MALACSHAISGQRVVSSTYFDIIYPESGAAMAYHLQQHADALYEDLHQKMDMKLAPRVSIVIQDMDGDIVNGLATVAAQPIIMLSVNHNAPYELRSQRDTAQLILRHELVHIFAGRYYKDSGMPWVMFGYLPQANFFAPNVFHEGYAQWYESDLVTGNGRALRINPLGEGLWRQEYAQGFRDYADVFEPVGYEESVLSYLYGAYFFTYVTERFGEQAITTWLQTRAQSDLRSVLNLSRNWEAAFAEPLATTWAQFIQYEVARLDQILTEPDVTEFTTRQAGLSYYGHPNALLSTDDYLLYMDYEEGFGRSRLMLEQNGSERSLGRHHADHIVGDADTAWFTQLDVCAKGEPLYSLYRLTLGTGKIDTIQPCGRIAQLAWNSDTQQLIVWRLHHGGSTLELLDRDGNTLQTLAEFGYDVALASLAWHPTAPERVLVNLKPSRRDNFDLYEFNIEQQAWTQLTDDPSLYYDAHWHNGQTLVYSRKAGAFLQAFVWDTQQGTELQLTRVTQNVLSPRWQPDGQLDFVTERGFYYQMATTATAKWQLRAQTKTPDTTLVRFAGQEASVEPGISHPYLPIEHIRLSAVIPTFSWANDTGLELGVITLLSDPTLRHSVDLQVSAQTSDVELSALAGYTYTRGGHEYSAVVARQATDGDYLAGYGFGYGNTTRLSRTRAVDGSITVIGAQRTAENRIENDHWLGLTLGLSARESNFNRQRPSQAAGIGLEVESDLSQLEHVRLLAHANSYLSLLRHHGVSLDTQVNYTTHADEPFQAGTVEGRSVILRPIVTGLGLQGLQTPLTDELLFSARTGLDISLTRPQRTLGSWGLGVQEIVLRPYARAVASAEGEVRGNLGSDLGTGFTALWILPLELSVGYAHDWDNLDKSSAGRWSAGLSSAF